VGHSLGAAGGDQMMAALGTWNEGLIPGIFSVDSFADDIHDSNLNFSQKHIEVDPNSTDWAFLNSKGFGGNNATACVLSPMQSLAALEKAAGSADFKAYLNKNADVEDKRQGYFTKLAQGENELIYRFGEGVLAGEDLEISKDGVKIPGYDKELSFDVENPYN
jgi:acetoacetyl-[acyl-carrier protein] synthase